MLSSVDLFKRFCKQENSFWLLKAVGLNKLLPGGQQYSQLPGYIYGGGIRVFHVSFQRILTKVWKLSTVNLLIKVACFVKEINNIFILKGAYLN